MNHATRRVGDQSNVKDLVVSTRPEKLLDVLAYNNTNGVLYCQVHEVGAAPVDGSVAKFSFPVQAGLGGVLGERVDMDAIYVCWSSTPLVKTIVVANSGSLVAILKG